MHHILITITPDIIGPVKLRTRVFIDGVARADDPTASVFVSEGILLERAKGAGLVGLRYDG